VCGDFQGEMAFEGSQKLKILWPRRGGASRRLKAGAARFSLWYTALSSCNLLSDNDSPSRMNKHATQATTFIARRVDGSDAIGSDIAHFVAFVL
jgi:hypothetical protein